MNSLITASKRARRHLLPNPFPAGTRRAALFDTYQTHAHDFDRAINLHSFPFASLSANEREELNVATSLRIRLNRPAVLAS